MIRSFLLSTILFVTCAANCQKYFLFIGTYTTKDNRGIYVYTFDASTGKAQQVSNTEGVMIPSYLALSPGGKFLYACNETAAGTVSAFRFDRTKGRLFFINKQPSGGADPAYVSVHRSGKWVIAANYTGGSLSAFPVNPDGSLQPYSQLIKHSGHSINKERQEAPHVHATVFSPEEDHLLATDLGLDRVMIYKFDAFLKQPLHMAEPPFISTEPGSGPRHLMFHPNKRWAYLMEEMGGMVIAYKYEKGRLKAFQKIAAHADTATGEFRSADIHVSPDGKFLYGSNRGTENNIAVFSIDKNGKLSLLGLQSTMGLTPRNFTIDPSGNYLLAANQETNNIVIFKRDTNTGMLTYTGEQINIFEPVCLKMIK